MSRRDTYPHATDPPLWWCRGTYDPMPVAFVGWGHPSSPRGWPVYRCLDCGEQIFHAPRPADEAARIREFATNSQPEPDR